MKVETTPLEGVLLISPRVFEDARGFFIETYHADRFREHGMTLPFVQDNHSASVRGTLRGLHYQIERPQGKLVRAIIGEIFDVAVDIRRGSPTFGKWYGVTLSAENRLQLYVPPGFAHGFCVTSGRAEVIYKCTDIYHPGGERGIRWNDPDIGIVWPVADPLLSDKDRNAPLLTQLAPGDLFRFPQGA
ncbi:MAG: dTDP-4-dehydrorhamnose 3,5-epimerase [Nitrospirae bacterium]|nr:dTDP-4-dehydrorhamnose 3,5-epimerase [Nitrospirota bacterium]